MSVNNPIPVEHWGRPRLQRQELGPMLHDLGHTVYDLAEVKAQETSLLYRPVDYEDLAIFAGRCIDMTMDAIEILEQDATHKSVEDFLDDSRSIPRADGSEYKDILTYGGSLRPVLKEGIDSGIVSPLQLYKVINDCENVMIQGELRPGSLDVEVMTERIGSPIFQAMLHQLAIGHNGSLGDAASNPNKLSPSSPELFHSFDQYGSALKAFAYDNDGRVIGYKPDFLAFQKQAKHKERKQGGAYGLSQSGGCPVRHANFPALGPRAQAYFEALGRPDAQPQKQGESLITRASRFVCTALLKSEPRTTT